MNYNGSIFQKSRVKDSKYIFKEIKLYYLGWPIGGDPCELWKTKITRAHVYKHTRNHTLTHTHTRKHTKTTHACKDTRTHATVCSRAPTHTHTHTHTHKVFFRDRRPKFVEPLAAHWQGGWIQFCKQILKTVVFSQSFEIPACFWICNSALDLIWFICGKIWC